MKPNVVPGLSLSFVNIFLEITATAKYGDWIEKLLINGIGVTVPMTQDGLVQYYSDYNPREASIYHANIPWTCCTGTRFQGVGDTPISFILKMPKACT